ncbi:hypothetical protein HYDPIDRAFT_104271 [Hydnomerulius pinastri MD-312]|nr:hypothetical protein HYDPIDRAFT_104271 [Hydnomerulius pinastri MD-312]
MSRITPRHLTPLYRLSRGVHSSIAVFASKDSQPHSADNYFKDVDESPPQDPSIHRIDAASEAAQRPHEPPSGQWSQAGMKTDEYRNANKEEPYDGLESGPEMKLRYGGTKKYSQDKGPETSKPDQGPEGSQRGGRKPEGRS